MTSRVRRTATIAPLMWGPNYSREDLLLIGSGVTAAAAAGAVAALGHGVDLLEVGVGLVAFVGALRWNVGFLVGVLLLAQLGGIPGLSLTHGQETIVLLAQLVTMGVYLYVRGDRAPLTLVEQLATLACALYLGWWIFVAARTIFEGGPVSGVLAQGRDLAYIPILLPLSMRLMRNTHPRRGFLLALGIGVGIFLVARILYGVGITAAGSLITTDRLSSSAGLIRLFSPMNYTLAIAVALGVGAALRAPGRRERVIGWAVALAGTVAVTLQLTRAIYFGLGVGFIVCIVVWYVQGAGAEQSLFRRRVSVLVAAIAALACVVVLIGPNVGPTRQVTSVGERLEEGVSNIVEGTGTVRIRENAAASIMHAVGNDWLTGLGFWQPSARYFSGAPEGNVRDVDLGVVNLLATEGAVAVVLLYVPLLALLAALLAIAGRRAPPVRPEIGGGGGSPPDAMLAWLPLGLAIWLAAALASSITLGYFFTRSGCALTGMILGLALAALLKAPGDVSALSVEDEES